MYVRTLPGHSGKVLCMSVTRQSQYLLTGSEDTSIIVWDLRAFTMRLRIYEHIAPVLCITSALNNSIIISGGDDSSIIITSLANGKVVMYLFYLIELGPHLPTTYFKTLKIAIKKNL